METELNRLLAEGQKYTACTRCGGDVTDCRAIIAVGDRGWSVLVWGSTHMICDFRERGLNSEDAFTPEQLKPGLHLWEGRIIGYESSSYIGSEEYEADYIGKFRPLSGEEWDFIIRGINPLSSRGKID
jgi:hypothetical protein